MGIVKYFGNSIQRSQKKRNGGRVLALKQRTTKRIGGMKDE